MLTLVIIGLTAIISISAFNKPELMNRFQYNPYAVKHRKQWDRLLTHGFLHGDWNHLFINMFVLYQFGANTESYFFSKFGITGRVLFVMFYLLGVLFAALPGYKKHQNNMYYNAVGASGAVAAVLFSSIMINPNAGLSLIFFPFFEFPAWVFGGLYLALEYYLDKRGGGNIAHDAHFYGAIFGVVFTIIAFPKVLPAFLNAVF